MDVPATPGSATTVLDAIATGIASGSPTTIAFDHRAYTLAELDELSNRMAHHLSALVDPGDRVGVMARNGLTALLGWWGAVKCGAVVVPYNTSNVGEILRHQLSDSAPRVLIAQSEFLPELAGHLGGLDLVEILIEGEASRVDGFAGPVLGIEAAIAAGDPGYRAHSAHPRDISHLIYTAGTTGPSKACMVSHAYLCHFSRDIALNVERRPEELLWTSLPMFHLAALTYIVGSVLIGGSISLASRFSVSRFWDEVERSGAAIVSVMGSMFPMIAKAGAESEAATRTRGRLRVLSGSPVSEELAEVFRERHGIQRVGAGAYGMTEASLITSTPPGEHRAGSAGRENDSFEVRIADEEGLPVPPNTPGRILCRPKRPGGMFDGYWRRPEDTLAVLRDLWFDTGDIGRLDEDGYLFFVDRGKDYLRRGGENISSFEIESVLIAHPDVIEVAVHSVPSSLHEDDVKVTAVRRPGSALTEAALHEWSTTRVPRYAFPRYIEFRERLPRNPVGRVLKYRLRAEGVTPGTWSAG